MRVLPPIIDYILGIEHEGWNWEAIAAISAVAGVILNAFLTFSIFLAARSVREAEKSRLIGLIIWTTERIQLIRDDTYRLMNTDIQEVASNAGLLHECRRLTGEYQQIAYFVKTKLIDEEYIYDMYGSLFIKVWKKLEPAVIEIRRQNGEPLTLEDGALARRDLESLVRKFIVRQEREPKRVDNSIKDTVKTAEKDGAERASLTL